MIQHVIYQPHFLRSKQTLFSLLSDLSLLIYDPFSKLQSLLTHSFCSKALSLLLLLSMLSILKSFMSAGQAIKLAH